MTEPTPPPRCAIPRHTGRRPVASAGRVCAEHLAELRDLLADLIDLWAELPYASLPLASTGPRYSGGGHGKHADPPAPINLAALALADPAARAKAWPTVNRDRNGDRLESNGADAPDVLAVLAAWCAEIAEERNTAIDATGLPGMVDALRRHLTWIAEQDWLLDFDRELRDCRRWLALAVGDDPRPAPFCDCPHCGTPLWDDRTRDAIKRRRYGQDVTEATGRTDRIACPGCRAEWSGVHGKAQLLRIVRDEQQRRTEAREAG